MNEKLTTKDVQKLLEPAQASGTPLTVGRPRRSGHVASASDDAPEECLNMAKKDTKIWIIRAGKNGDAWAFRKGSL